MNSGGRFLVSLRFQGMSGFGRMARPKCYPCPRTPVTHASLPYSRRWLGRDWDFFCKTATFRRENVLCRIDVAMMIRATFNTGSLFYSKSFHALQVCAPSTATTGLGLIPFIDCIEPHARVIALLLQHGPQHAPACVKHGFRHRISCTSPYNRSPCLGDLPVM
jgi:hypothetical protein